MNGEDHPYSVQYVADNVDHIMANLDGKSTLHAMGMMATVTPARRKMVSKIPVDCDISKEKIISLAHINIPYYAHEDKICPHIMLNSWIEPCPVSKLSTDIDLLWKLSKHCDIDRPGWFGFMQICLA